MVGAQVDTISSRELRDMIQEVLRVNGQAITQEKVRMRRDGLIDFGGGGVEDVSKIVLLPKDK